VVHGATVSLCSTPLTLSVIAIFAGVGNRSADRAAGLWAIVFRSPWDSIPLAETPKRRKPLRKVLAATVQIGLAAYENTETSPRAVAPLARGGNKRHRGQVPARADLFAAHIRDNTPIRGSAPQAIEEQAFGVPGCTRQ
jgi:hypothetical protein